LWRSSQADQFSPFFAPAKGAFHLAPSSLAANAADFGVPIAIAHNFMILLAAANN